MATPRENRLKDTIHRPRKKISNQAVPVDEIFASDKLTRHTTIYLTEQTWKNLKLKAIEDETSTSRILENLARQYFNDNPL